MQCKNSMHPIYLQGINSVSLPNSNKYGMGKIYLREKLLRIFREHYITVKITGDQCYANIFCV